MRSFAAGLALFLAFLTGTTALAAYVADHVLLDPSQVGKVAGQTLGQPELRDKLLARTVPGYDQLNPAARSLVGTVAERPSTRRALEKVRLHSDGTLSLVPLQNELVRGLRANGANRVADSVAGAGRATVDVPSTYLDRYDAARRLSRTTWLGAALITAGLVGLALLASPRRSATVRSTGVAAVLASIVVGGGYWLLPAFAQAASSDPAAQAVAAVLTGDRHAVLLTVLPVAVVGLLLVVLGVATGRRRRG